MWCLIFLCFLGLCSGTIISAGLSGFVISLSVVPRYAEVSRTASQLTLYESIAFWGTILGNLMTLFPISPPGGSLLLAATGIGFGIFLGSWILALSELADVFPVISRRIHFRRGFSLLIFSLALGKTLGCLFYFYQGWQSV